MLIKHGAQKRDVERAAAANSVVTPSSSPSKSSVADFDPFLAKETSGGSSISPYHQAANNTFSHVRNERANLEIGIQFQVAWHREVSDP